MSDHPQSPGCGHGQEGKTSGLIETVRVTDGQTPLWPWHRARLLSSAAALGHPLPEQLPGPGALAAAAAVAGISGPAALRLTLSRGTVQLEARPLGPVRPWSICIAPGPPPAAPHKTTDRSRHRSAAAHAARCACDEALWCDTEGSLIEGTISNLFVLVDGELRTPPLESGCLPGIARARLLARASLRGHPIREARIKRCDLNRATEAFCTNAARGAIPLVRWEGHGLPSVGLWRHAATAIFTVYAPEAPLER